jgi:hypothetical protein
MHDAIKIEGQHKNQMLLPNGKSNSNNLWSTETTSKEFKTCTEMLPKQAVKHLRHRLKPLKKQQLQTLNMYQLG